MLHCSATVIEIYPLLVVRECCVHVCTIFVQGFFLATLDFAMSSEQIECSYVAMKTKRKNKHLQYAKYIPDVLAI